MLDSAAQAALAQRILALSPAAQTEVTVQRRGLRADPLRAQRDRAERRPPARPTVRVRAVVDGRVGIAATNDLADAALRAVAERACAMARLAPRDDGFPGLAGAPRVPQPRGRVLRRRPLRRRPTCAPGWPATSSRSRERDGLWCAGYAKTSHELITIANSQRHAGDLRRHRARRSTSSRTPPTRPATPSATPTTSATSTRRASRRRGRESARLAGAGRGRARARGR